MKPLLSQHICEQQAVDINARTQNKAAIGFTRGAHMQSVLTFKMNERLEV